MRALSDSKKLDADCSVRIGKLNEMDAVISNWAVGRVLGGGWGGGMYRASADWREGQGTDVQKVLGRACGLMAALSGRPRVIISMADHGQKAVAGQ